MMFRVLALTQILGMRGTVSRLQHTGTEEPLPPDTQHLQEELSQLQEKYKQLEQQLRVTHDIYYCSNYVCNSVSVFVAQCGPYRGYS